MRTCFAKCKLFRKKLHSKHYLPISLYLRSAPQKVLIKRRLCKKIYIVLTHPPFYKRERLRCCVLLQNTLICHILQQNVVLKIEKFVAKCNSTGMKKLLFLLKNVNINFVTIDVVNMDSCCIVDDK